MRWDTLTDETLHFLDKNRKGYGIQSAMHQLRDALHSQAIEGFYLLVTKNEPVQIISLIPILVTNAEIRILNHKKLLEMDEEKEEKAVSPDHISIKVPGVLCRVPQDLRLQKMKYDSFIKKYNHINLERFNDALPLYKTNRTFKHHIENFFRCTPKYTYVIHKSVFDDVIKRELKWAKQLKPAKNESTET